MSEAACGIIHPDAITYATGRETILRCSGLVEHVTYCGIGGEADLLLIAPCTANTLCKIAAGIDDTSVTTFVTTAIGRKMPVVLVPAMHECMYEHPAVIQALETLRSWGISIVDPIIEEEKAKIAGTGDIVLAVERELLGKPLAGKRVLITSGPCQERVDDVRILTTRSSGLMGRECARQAYRLGANVTVIHNSSLPQVTNIIIESAAEMREAVHRVFATESVDYYISAAAISDFAPVPVDGKIPSGAPQLLELKPQPKLLSEVTEKYGERTSMVAFKLGENAEDAVGPMLSSGIRAVITNKFDTMGAPEGVYVMHTSAGSQAVTMNGTKEEVAIRIWDGLL
jgi:phosphopantothenoylcysteine decarboxylase/phosphopantothenate--cysteine ligase